MLMPGVDGAELITVLARDRPTLPVIAISGAQDAKEYRRISLSRGARIALRKPVNRAELITAANDLLAQQAQNQAVSPAII